MKKYLTCVEEFISRRATALYKLQLAFSCIALALLSWNVTILLKRAFLADLKAKINVWAYIFYHPIGSNLFNYIAISVVIGACALSGYLLANRRNVEWLKGKIEGNRTFVFFATISSLFLVGLILVMPSGLGRMAVALLVVIIPFFSLFKPRSLVRSGIMLSAISWLFLISADPLLVAMGPAYLMNEYADIYGETYVKSKPINEKEFLDKIKDINIREMLRVFYYLVARYESLKMDHEEDKGLREVIGSIFAKYKYIDIVAAQRHVIHMLSRDDTLYDDLKNEKEAYAKEYLEGFKRQIENLNRIDVETLKEFYRRNEIEYAYQNMSRGQINHIGHVLNPLNEYQGGKPLSSIYMQYGLGNTLLMKWTMDLFGGVSIDNYYKCYFYYVVYYILFIFMLYLIFKERMYVFTGTVFLAASFFGYSFIGFILAPGIIPSIHFLDAGVLIFMLLFLRNGRIGHLTAAALLSLLSIVINRQFGIILAAAFIGAMSFYIIENKKGMNRLLWITTIIAFSFLSVVVFQLTNIGTLGKTFYYYLTGLFSWPARPLIKDLTILYLVLSYSFLLMLKKVRNGLKYLYLLVFIYSQGLFVYYYWSGLNNHLPMVMPFVGLQLMLMIHISENLLSGGSTAIQRTLDVTKYILFAVVSLFALLNAKDFYMEKVRLQRSFTFHRIHNWEFDRARLITTINPEPVRESINLIKKYSPDERGIFIISKYDNLFPFLSARYSRMPFFEMHWHLFSESESREAIERIRGSKPDFIFVDSNIDRYDIDPWAQIYYEMSVIKERASRIERYAELYKLFLAVKGDYEKVEEGTLISVYRRKTWKDSRSGL